MFHIRPCNDLSFIKIDKRWPCRKDFRKVWYIKPVYSCLSDHMDMILTFGKVHILHRLHRLLAVCYTGTTSWSLTKSYFAWPSCVYLIKNQMKKCSYNYKVGMQKNIPLRSGLSLLCIVST